MPVPQIVIQIAIAIALAVVSYALTPKPPKPKPPGVGQGELPSVKEGKNIPVIFGTVTIRESYIAGFYGPNVQAIKTKSGK